MDPSKLMEKSDPPPGATVEPGIASGGRRLGLMSETGRVLLPSQPLRDETHTAGGEHASNGEDGYRQ